MRPERWSIVPIALGLILLASWAADSHELIETDRDADVWLFVRAELAYLGGLWLLSGLAPRWARFSMIAVFVGVWVHDLARIVLSNPPRPVFARVAVGPWWVLGSDLIVLFVLLSWRPQTAVVRRLDSHPGRLIWTVVIALTIGVAIDRSHVGRFPIVATARSGGPTPSPGLSYLVYLPGGYYRSSRRWPLILYLHGAGDTGRGLDRVRAGGLPRRIEAGVRMPFIVVAPYCLRGGWDIAALDGLLDEVLGRYAIDPDRIYLTGLSMGGYGTWAWATARPERFAAIAPICGGGDPARIDRLQGVPTWAFHGAEDPVVPPEESRRMAAALERAGGDVKLTIYRETGHDAWTAAYADPALYAWFLDHRRRVGTGGPASPAPAVP